MLKVALFSRSFTQIERFVASNGITLTAANPFTSSQRWSLQKQELVILPELLKTLGIPYSRLYSLLVWNRQNAGGTVEAETKKS